MNTPAFRLENLTSQWGFKLWNLVFDLPGEKVNKLSREVMTQFDTVLSRLEQLGKEKAIDVLVLTSGKPGMFIAGADIQMIQAVKSYEEAEQLSKTGHSMSNRWEDLPFPTIAAIAGPALGGGCELALCCTSIVLSNDPAARIGLPEVMLGIIPGMGGCVRMPQRVGLATALDLILTSRALKGDAAVRAGLADACLPKENFEQGVFQWALVNLPKLQKGVRIAREPKLGGMGGAAGALLEKTPFGRMVIFKKAREGVLSRTRGKYPAPLEAISVIERNGVGYNARLRGAARAKALALEAKGFGKCAVTEISRNLIQIFFLTEALKKSNGLPEGRAVETHPVRSAGVLGAGVMGGGIAQLFADRGIVTRMKDISTQGLETGMKAAARIFGKQMKKRRINRREYQQKMNLIAPTLDYSGFHTLDVVVEAVIEKMDIKKKVFQDLENHISADTVVATNTSSLSVSEMQTAFTKPGRFVGMHFFNPVEKMPLVEVIRGKQSSDHAVATIYQLVKQIGKIPIVVGDCPGFLVNRLLLPYLNEASYLLMDQVPIDEMDEVILDFGMPMGPMTLIDEIGVDVGEKVLHILAEAYGERMKAAPICARIAQSGRHGKKNGKGLYVYSGKDSREKNLDPEIYKILEMKPKPGIVSRDEILDRCMLPMINEATRILDEKIVERPDEVDLGMIMGTGFPPFRGGLLRYADTLGPKEIVQRLKKYQDRFGARFEPAPGMLARAQSGQLFYS